MASPRRVRNFGRHLHGHVLERRERALPLVPHHRGDLPPEDASGLPETHPARRRVPARLRDHLERRDQRVRNDARAGRPPGWRHPIQARPSDVRLPVRHRHRGFHLRRHHHVHQFPPRLRPVHEDRVSELVRVLSLPDDHHDRHDPLLEGDVRPIEPGPNPVRRLLPVRQWDRGRDPDPLCAVPLHHLSPTDEAGTGSSPRHVLDHPRDQRLRALRAALRDRPAVRRDCDVACAWFHLGNGPRRAHRVRGAGGILPPGADRPGGGGSPAHEADLCVGPRGHLRGPGTGRRAGLRDLQGPGHPRSSGAVHHAPRPEGGDGRVRPRTDARPLAESGRRREERDPPESSGKRRHGDRTFHRGERASGRPPGRLRVPRKPQRLWLGPSPPP